jgi:hypothetical protein
MAPMVHGLEARYADRLEFTYLDRDDPATLKFQTALGYRYQPELYLLDAQGNVLQKWIGLVQEEQLVTAFEAAIGP